MEEDNTQPQLPANRPYRILRKIVEAPLHISSCFSPFSADDAEVAEGVPSSAPPPLGACSKSIISRLAAKFRRREPDPPGMGVMGVAPLRDGSLDWVH